MTDQPISTFVNTQVPISLDAILRLIAAQQKVSRSDIVRAALEEYVARHREMNVVVLQPAVLASESGIVTEED
jgi:hypothetical protein